MSSISRRAMLKLLGVAAALPALPVRTRAAGAEPSDLAPVDPRCDSAKDPLGVDSAPPRLSWRLRSATRGQRQTAWQVLAASSTDMLAANRGDLWDSGRVESDAQLHVPYAGRALRSSAQVFWQVRVWDRAGLPSPWSEPATWTMGVVAEKDWGLATRWITDPSLLKWRRPKLGFCSADAPTQDTPKWVQIDLGAAHPLDTVRLHALRHTVPELLGFPLRFKLEAADNAGFLNAAVVADQTAQDSRNAWATTISLPANGVRARYLRLTVTKLRNVDGRICLALSQLEVLSGGKNVAAGGGVTASDSLEQAPWSAAAITDGLGVPGTNPRANDTLLLRREFSVRPGLRRALVHVCGLGHYELSANGTRVDAGLLTPGWTNTAKTCLYDTHDLTALLRPGANAVGLCLAGGMFNLQEGRYVKFTTPFRPLVAFGEIRLEYTDGSVETVSTDGRWRAAPGPITFANMFGGEDFDARREPAGWSRPGFDDSAWTPAVETAGPGGKLRGFSHASPPFRLHERFKPAAVRELRPGAAVYDFGQNVAAMPRLRVRGPAGATVRMIPAELLKKDGSVDRGSCGGGQAYWQYTLRGDAAGETWEPKFFYHGCRYLQVELTVPEGAPPPVVESLESVVVHSDSPAAGDFVCSNELFNRIRTLVRWAQRSNLAHVITDCPHREKLGWLEQYHLNGPALRYEWDLARLFEKTFGDMADGQQPDGLVPSIAPEFVIFTGGFRDSPEWGGALILAAWQHYVWTGNDAPLRRNYPAMRRYVAYLAGRADGHILSHGLGDWYDLGPQRPGRAQLTPVPLTATAIYYECVHSLARIAGYLGQPADAQRYAAQAAAIKEAFNREFFNAATGVYATGSQTAQALPLVLDLVAPAQRPAVLDALVRAVRSRGNAITAGDVGYRYLLRALGDGGRSDVIFDMNNQSEKPGYGYQLAHGATSLTEAWDTNPNSSQNHFMLGQIIEWFYHDLAGLAPDPGAPGFKRVLVRPQPVPGLAWARASHDTPRGRVEVAWRREAGRFTLDVALPPNTTATVCVPAASADAVTEGGQPAARSAGVRFARLESASAVFEVESGRYAFAAPA